MTWKNSTIVIFITLLISGFIGADEKSPKSIRAEELNSISVIGKLGIPLGRVAKVRATIVDSESTGRKADQSTYFLKITEVDGVTLATPPLVRFFLERGSKVKLANDSFQLQKLKTGKKAGTLTSKQIDQLKKGYIGSQHILRVYETGGFSGIPDKLPLGQAWQGTSFQFRTHLRILSKEISK